MHRKVCTLGLLLITALSVAAQCTPEDGEGPYLSVVRHIRFDDTQTITRAEAKAIAQELVGLCFHRNQPGEVSERIRDAFQRHGFFKAAVLDPLRVTVIDPGSVPTPVDVAVVVNEGDRYRLGDIEFRANTAFRTATLRPAFALNPGDIFDIEKVRQGLKALRNIYGEAGYINFTPVPDTRFDETNQTISLAINCDEGAQFRLGRFEVGGVPAVAEPLLKDWKLKTGDIYDSSIVGHFLLRHSSVLQTNSLQIKQNRQAKTVDVRIVVCPADYYCFDQ